MAMGVVRTYADVGALVLEVRAPCVALATGTLGLPKPGSEGLPSLL